MALLFISYTVRLDPKNKKGERYIKIYRQKNQKGRNFIVCARWMGVLVLPVQDFGRLCKVTGPYNEQWLLWLFLFLLPFFLNFTFSFSSNQRLLLILLFYIYKRNIYWYWCLVELETINWGNTSIKEGWCCCWWNNDNNTNYYCWRRKKPSCWDILYTVLIRRRG